MAITVNVAHKSGRGNLNNNDALQSMLYIALTEPYPSGGYPLDLKPHFGFRIDAAFCTDFGSYHPSYNTITKILRITVGGSEVPAGTSFYDAVNDLYAKFLIWVFNFNSYYDAKGIQPDLLITGPIADNRMLRKDTDDTFQPNVTTIVPATSTLKVWGEGVIEDGGAQTVKSGGSSTIEKGGMQIIAGSVVVPSGGTLPANTTPSVGGAQFWGLDGSITPIVTFFTGGVEGTTVTINCISQATIVHDPTKIDLMADENLVMDPSDYLDLKLEGGIWKQTGVLRKYGSHTVAPGGTYNLIGTFINSWAGTFPNSDTTQSTVDGSFFTVDGTITPNIETLTAGTEGKTIVIQCIAGTTTLHQGPTIDLVADVDFVMKTGDSITLKMTNGVWKEPVGRVVKNGSTTIGNGGTVEVLPGGNQVVGGNIVKTNATTFASSTPSIAGGNLFLADGAITSSLTGFSGGINGTEFTIYCVGGAVTIVYNPSSIVLKGKTNVTMHIDDSISFRMESGVWVETSSNIKVGWVPINDTGMVYVMPGGVVNNGGVEIKTPITPPSAGTLDASKNSQFDIDPAITPSITNIIGNGTIGQFVGMTVPKDKTGRCTIYSNANINLTKDLSFAMAPGDGITFQLQSSGVWVEYQRVVFKSATTGAYNTQDWASSITLAPTTLDMIDITVRGDCSINFSNLPAGITVVLGFESDDVTTHNITFGTNTSCPYSSLNLKVDQFASVNCYCNGTVWRIGEPKFSLS